VRYPSKTPHLGFLWLAIVATVGLCGWAAAQTGAPADTLSSVLQPRKLAVDAKSAVLMESQTGQILVEFNEDERIPPASFAKVLTLYVVFEALDNGKIRLDDEVFVSQKAWKTGGSQMFIEVNTRVSVDDLIKGVAVVSGNDACVALAEHLAGSTDIFARAMNEAAAKIGMTNSHFTNPHGLPDPDQYTTAHDMAVLARAYIRRFPEALRYHSMLEYTYNDITQPNRNRLLRQDPSVDGLKTGYIAAAGYHLLATAKRDGRRLIAVVMGAKGPRTREREARRLLNYGYRNFELLSLFPGNQVVTEVPVWKGTQDTLALIATVNGALTVPTELKNKVSVERVVPDEVIAPITQGQVLGEGIIRLDNQVVKRVPFAAQQAVERAGLVRVLSHSAYLLGRNYLGILFIGVAILVLLVLAYLFLVRKKKRTRSNLRL
jgi:D-alanyl-D-alanine carboxypeptidase (penicillin-binding protein 5/6)